MKFNYIRKIKEQKEGGGEDNEREGERVKHENPCVYLADAIEQ